MLGCRTIPSKPSFLCLSPLHQQPVCHNSAMTFLLYLLLQFPKSSPQDSFAWVEKSKAVHGQLRTCPRVPHPGACLEPAAEGFCGRHPWAGAGIKAAIWRSPSLAVTHLELLAESELDLTSEKPSHAIQLWILRDCSFEEANMCMCLNTQM